MATPAAAASSVEAASAQATALYTAAALYIAAAEEPEDEEFNATTDAAPPVARAAKNLAITMIRSIPDRYGSGIPWDLLQTQMSEEDVIKLTDRLAGMSVRQAAEHWRTIQKRVLRSDPTATKDDVTRVFRMDTAWQRAAARTLSTRIAAETALSMRPEVDAAARVPHRIVWISRGDHKVRASHRRLHGKHRKPGSAFKVWPTGQRLEFPGDPRAPLDETINCRCSLILVPESTSHEVPDTFRVSDEDWAAINRLAASGWSGAANVQAELDLMEELARIQT